MEQLDREHVLVVVGAPAPKGSLKCVGKGKRHQLVENSPRTAPWRERVAAGARTLTVSGLSGPVGVEVTFTIDRPTSHYLTTLGACPGCGLNEAACSRASYRCCPDCRHPRMLSTEGRRRPYPSRRSQGLGGDVDKLARVVLDALEDAGTLADDAQVVELIARKTFADGPGVLPDALTRPGARIRLYPLEETP